MFKIQKYCLLLVTSFYCCNVSTEALTRSTTVDLIKRGLDEQPWVKGEEQCLRDMMFILDNVKNHTLWAVWIWNSNQHPLGTFYGSKYSLGNYDQCLQASSIIGDPVVRTQYCLADVKLTAGEAKKRVGKPNAFGLTDNFLETKFIYGRILNVIKWGVCLPATCNVDSVAKVLKVFYSVNPYTAAEPNILVDSCELEGEEIVYGREYYIFLTIITSLMVTASLSTCYLQNIEKRTLTSKITYSFNLRRNWSSFTKITGDEIPVVNFFKTLHLVLTTCLHAVFFVSAAAVSNDAYIAQTFDRHKDMYSKLLVHVDLPSLENFFVISGLLLMKSLMKKKKRLSTILIQRYIRLIGSFAFMVFSTMSILKYTNDGPLWNIMIKREQKACEENWFWSLLLLNNYVNSDNICQLVAWYVPCDYQLAIMGVTLYGIWQWNKRTGKLVTIITAFLMLVIPGIVTYWKEIPGVLLYDIEKMNNIRSNEVYLDTYIKSHNRGGPYLLGMAMGYILSEYNPAKYRGVISRHWSHIGYIIGTTISIMVWTSAGSWCFTNYSAWNSAVYAALNRNIWALMFCLIIGISEYGDEPRIRSMMAWPGFVILSRLSFGVYITHSLILQRIMFSQRNPTHIDLFNATVDGLGVLLVSMLASIWLWLFVEAPLVNLTNLILNPNTKVRENGTKLDAKMNDHIDEIKYKKYE